jgi:hypothetical protein
MAGVKPPLERPSRELLLLEVLLEVPPAGLGAKNPELSPFFGTAEASPPKTLSS